MPTDPTPAGRPRIGDETASPALDREQRLKDLFPEAVSEGQLDFDKLRLLCGAGTAGAERYQFGWAGRADAVDVLRSPSRATLLPDPDRSVGFDATRNAVIEGDNLEVLKLLGRGYAGRVKLIYIDPPYNTGNDFVYPDDFRDPLGVYLRMTGQADEAGKLLTSNPNTSGRYHSAWLSMMYPRLFLARQLLRDDGVIFVSIDDHEVHHLRMLMNEVFGEENFIAQIVWKGATDNNPTRVAIEHEYIVCFTKSKEDTPAEWKSTASTAKSLIQDKYQQLRGIHQDNHGMIQEQLRRYIRDNREDLAPLTHYDRVDDGGPYTGSRKVHNPKPGGQRYDVLHPVTRKVCVPPANGYRFPEATFKALVESGKVLFGDDETQIVQIKEYLADYDSKLPGVIALDSRTGSNVLKSLFSNAERLFTGPKPPELLHELFAFLTSGDDLVLDFFAGSGTTAQAVLELNREDGGNRQFILVQLPEPTGNTQFPNIADICAERVRRVIAKLNAAPGDLTRTTPEDLGFKVFRLAESHLKTWDGSDDRTPAGYQRALSLFAADTLRPGWTEAGLLWEVAL